MTSISQVKDCAGFDLRVAVTAVSPKDNRALSDMEDDIQVFVDDGLNKYQLYKRWSGGDLYFCRKFFWVDGDRQLLVRVFNQGREDYSERLMLRISDSRSNDLLGEVRELLDSVQLQESPSPKPKVEDDASLKVFQEFQSSYGNIGVELILHFLQDPDIIRQRKAIRLLSYCQERIALEPLCIFLGTVSDQILLAELGALFGNWQDPEVLRAISRMYKENPNRPDLRLKALEVLGQLKAPEAREALSNAAEFDPDPAVKVRAQEILKGTVQGLKRRE